MAILRKMLGDIYSEECQDLMRLIETQSHQTLMRWAIQYAKENYLIIYQDDVLENAVYQCELYLNKEVTLKDIKLVLKDVRGYAGKIKDPVHQASARAISTALATISTPTNAFGFLLYGAAAKAYQEVGVKQTKECYDLLATKELLHALADLKEVAVVNELNPVKVNWNC